ncbi:hypothetical protein PR202_ga26772 [Eleusine coracana subsp. coracana]|uniref:PUM-HD domain-containing protein n=1 Tax=Eleusine coracana subsp. coracana TaxID=191504 RepID=A0AAV5DFW9_ELECO|nr:hypothetical protein PR202_ga26772 [Eleusine coracana subsp. coracana]
MEMMGPRAAAAAGDVKTEEKEMDLLLSEIPHVTSPQGHQRPAAAIAAIGHGNGVHGGAGAGHGYATQRYSGGDPYLSVSMNRCDDGGQVHSAGAPAASTRRSPPLAPVSEDLEKQWLANQLLGLHIGDAPAVHAQAALQRQRLLVPPVKSAALGDAKALGYVAARPQRFVSDVGYDGYGEFAGSMDAGIGGFVYNRVGNYTGTGWGQGLVHPDLAESYLRSGQAGAEHNWEFFSPSPVALDARGGPKRHYAYGVPMADNGFARGGFNQFEALHGNGLMFDGKKNINFPDYGRDRKLQHYVNSRAFELGNSKTLRYENMVGVKGYIYFMAKDQNGCRFLQQKFEEGKNHVDVIFEGIIDHIAELMINSFANYLVQKMLDVCDEEQRLRIIVMLTEDPVKLLKISLNTHGTRAVQKLIETVRSRKQIARSLFRPYNQASCILSMTLMFIFEAAATHCFEMAIHRHGCCVLQRCISSARGGYQAKLIVEVCAHGFELAQDPFGNYVVQYVLELKIPSANAHLASQFKGRYVYLSKQKGPVNNDLVEAIRPHEEALRTSPCCKRISRALSKR